MTKLFYCKSCEAEGDDISPYSRRAAARATIWVSAEIRNDTIGAYSEDDFLDGKALIADSYTCHECEAPVQIVDIECPHDWRSESGGYNNRVTRKCELCDVVQAGRAVFDA